MQAKLKSVSLHDVEEGIANARTSADQLAKNTADQHALNLATAEHERLLLPLQKKLDSLDRTSATTRAGMADTTRTLREYEARLASVEAQKCSTVAAFAVAKRNHTSYTSGLCAHSRQPPPVPAAQPGATLATFVAPAAQQPPTSANLATFVPPAARQPALANLATLVAPLPLSLWLRIPPRFPPLSLRRDLWFPPPLPQPGPRLSLFQLGQPCRRRPPENPRPPHPGRSWSRVHTGSLSANRLSLPKMTPTSSCASQN